jgi:peptidoglycan/xylan/chitin deacetylase (PgdA/CDA1 family)
MDTTNSPSTAADWLAAEGTELDRSRRECYSATSSSFLARLRCGPVDQPMADIEALASGQPRPVWPGGARFAVCLTHDVDNVAWYDARMHVRRIRAQCRHLLRRPLERRAYGGLKSMLYAATQATFRARRTDPLHGYERWLELESTVGARSTFYFLPDRYRRPHHSDGGYRYDDQIVFDGNRCTVAEMIHEIGRRGGEIGLHASWYTHDSTTDLLRDKRRLEAVAGTNIVSVRQHYLHCDVRRSPSVYQQAGLTCDSSLGFNDDVGFRHATSWPYMLNDCATGNPTGVVELPLAIQDRCLTGPRGKIDVHLAIERGLTIAGRVEDVGGVVTLLWHPRLIVDNASMHVYVNLLEQLRKRGAWFGTAREIADWWRSGRQQAHDGAAAVA